MNVLLTCGPSHEVIDSTQRVTTNSTGELGTLIAETLAEAGHVVTCFRGTLSSYPAPLFPVRVVPFETRDELEAKLHKVSDPRLFPVILHAAELYPYKVDSQAAEDGSMIVTLRPASPLVSSLRELFPSSIIFGWQHRFQGSLHSAIAAAQNQIESTLTDCCVLEGPAYGKGFGVLSRSGERVHLPDRASFCSYIKEFIEAMPQLNLRPGPESFHPLAALFPLQPFI